jgi:hypothetical protein
VPVGYMLGTDTPDGELAVVLCPAHSELPTDVSALPVSGDFHLEHGASHKEKEHDARADSCAFSLAFVPLITSPESADNLLVDTRDARFFEPRQRVPAGNATSATSARGPPQHS